LRWRRSCASRCFFASSARCAASATSIDTASGGADC
jgi:hypothetical protein